MMPIPAPQNTSLIQWRLLSMRITPVAVARPYPAMLYRGLTVRPYSLWRMVAATKAVAVCPDGNEFRVLLSGRIWLAVYLMLFTEAAMMANDIALLTR